LFISVLNNKNNLIEFKYFLNNKNNLIEFKYFLKNKNNKNNLIEFKYFLKKILNGHQRGNSLIFVNNLCFDNQVPLSINHK
jgi:hypothetical protein